MLISVPLSLTLPDRAFYDIFYSVCHAEIGGFLATVARMFCICRIPFNLLFDFSLVYSFTRFITFAKRIMFLSWFACKYVCLFVLFLFLCQKLMMMKLNYSKHYGWIFLARLEHETVD